MTQLSFVLAKDKIKQRYKKKHRPETIESIELTQRQLNCKRIFINSEKSHLASGIYHNSLKLS